MARVGATLRVGLDVTALIGHRTGIGQVVAGMVDALEARDDVEVVRFAMTWRGRGESGASHRGLPARPMRAIWRRVDHPRLERWTGPIDVAHGTNYVVPPTRAARVVSVHDLTFLRFPKMVTRDVASFEALVRRAVGRGAWVHTDSRFVADEVRTWLGSAIGDRVRAVAPGPTWARSGSPGFGALSASELDGGPIVLMLGTIEPRKDIASVVPAWPDVIRAVPGARLVIAGAIGPLGRSEVDDTLAALTSTAARDRVVPGIRCRRARPPAAHRRARLPLGV